MFPSSLIRKFVLENLPKGSIVSGGKEYNCPSPFVDNPKPKFWINLNTGKFQDFAANKRGSFIYLVALLSHKDYREVEADLLYESIMSYGSELLFETNIEEDRIISYTEFKEHFTPIDPESPLKSELAEKAFIYLAERKLFDLRDNLSNLFFVSEDGIYKNRLIVPYYRDGKMFYFQGRALGSDTSPKYLNPSSENIKSSSVLYPYNERDSYVIVTEGAIDARSLQIQGVNATSTLSNACSKTQISMLADYPHEIIMAYDNDPAGRSGMKRFEHLRRKYRIPRAKFCFPPKGFKDWNEAHVADVDLEDHINKNTRELTDVGLDMLDLNLL